MENSSNVLNYGLDTSASSNLVSDLSDSAGTMILSMIIIFLSLIVLGLAITLIISMWKIFVKAGRPGWASLVPIYGQWLLLEMAGFPGWLSLLVLVPYAGQFVQLALNIIIGIKLPEKFKKEPTFAIGLILLPVVFYPMLGFGKSEYTGDDIFEEETDVVIEEPIVRSETEE